MRAGKCAVSTLPAVFLFFGHPAFFFPIMLKQLLLLTGGLTLALTTQAQWTTQTVPYAGQGLTTNYLDAVDAQVCWAAAVDQQLFTTQHQYARTTDGGTTWTVGDISGLGANEYVSAIAGLSATTAVVATRTDGVNGRLLRTTDGGATWTVCTTATQLNSSRSYPLYLHFFDAQNGLCIGDAITEGNTSTFELYRTTNAGLTWTRVPTANLPALLSSEELRGYPNSFGNSYWFITDKGRVFRSADAGLTWAVSTPNLGNFVQSVAFRDANNGVAVAVSTTSTNHRLVSSADGGATWLPVTYAGPLRGWSLEYVPGTTTLLAVGINRYGANGDQGSSISQNNGLTWQGLENTKEHIVLDAAAAGGVWTGAFNSDTGEGLGVYKLNPTVLSARASSALQSSLRVAPNPATGGRFRVYTGLATATPVQVQVSDALGRPVFTFAGTGTQLPVDLSGQAAGLYVVRLQTAEGSATQKLLVR